MMKRFYILFLGALFFTAGCGEKNIMETPVSASNFQELANKLEALCYKTDNQTCGYINGAIYSYMPAYKTEGFVINAASEALANKIYKKLNGKTPDEIIEIYKGILLGDLEKSKRHDKEIVQNLDDIKATFDKTKHFANSVNVSHISVDFRKKEPLLSFNVSNNTNFDIRQLVAEAEFYTASETFLGREKAFGYTLSPVLKPGKTETVKVKISSVPKEDIVLIKAAKNLRIRVLVSSVQTGSKKDNESVLILALPGSYFKMRELIKESDTLYNDTVDKIKAINSKK